jgi:hypothetical protein
MAVCAEGPTAKRARWPRADVQHFETARGLDHRQSLVMTVMHSSNDSAGVPDMTSVPVPGIKMHGTGECCTNLHGFQAAANFYPNFYPKRQRS